MKTIKFITSVFVTIVLYSSCKKDKAPDPQTPPPVNQGEVITTLKLIFTDSANTSSISAFVFKDADGEGGNGPSIFDTIKIQSNKTYFVSVLLLDETKNPVDTTSNEVLEEANDHLLFFHHNNVNVNTSYIDQDSNNPPLPIGLSTKWKTGNISSGTSQVILKHQPGTKNGSEIPGETDIDVIFPSKVQ